MDKKVYELSISSNYVHTWGIEEAVREIMQNAIDSQIDGNPLSVSYSNGTLTIQNSGCNLDISTLVLGNSGKNDTTKYIGTYGEGFKLAIVVLLRNGIATKIHTNGQKWIPEFRKSVKFGIDTLHIDVFEETSSKDIISFELSGIEYDTFESIRDNSLAMLVAMGFNIGGKIETEYGDILIDKRYKGKMFVNGLYVQSDSSFQYGYNFKPKYLQLDRDRKAINYYKMRELTAKAVTSQSDVKLVKTAMERSYIDVRDVIEHMDAITQEFKVNFANQFMNDHDLDENTFVGLKKEVVVCGKEKTFEVESEAIAMLVNSGLGKEEEYKQIKSKAATQSKKEQAMSYYRGSDFEELVDFLYENKEKFENDELIGKLESWSGLYTSYFHEIAEDVFAKFYDESEEDDDE